MAHAANNVIRGLSPHPDPNSDHRIGPKHDRTQGTRMSLLQNTAEGLFSESYAFPALIRDTPSYNRKTHKDIQNASTFAQGLPSQDALHQDMYAERVGDDHLSEPLPMIIGDKRQANLFGGDSISIQRCLEAIKSASEVKQKPLAGQFVPYPGDE